MERVWALVGSRALAERIGKALGPQLPVRHLRSLPELEEALGSGAAPSLVLAEPELKDECFFAYLQRQASMAFDFAILSSQATAELIEKSFRHGAWEFFKVPAPDDLLRIKVEMLLRKREAQQKPALGAELDILSLTVTARGQKTKLTVTEFQIFLILRDSAAEGASRSDLITRIWGETTVVGKTLDVHLFKLRRKIEALGLQIELRLDRRYQLKPRRAR